MKLEPIKRLFGKFNDAAAQPSSSSASAGNVRAKAKARSGSSPPDLGTAAQHAQQPHQQRRSSTSALRSSRSASIGATATGQSGGISGGAPPPRQRKTPSQIKQPEAVLNASTGFIPEEVGGAPGDAKGDISPAAITGKFPADPPAAAASDGLLSSNLWGMAFVVVKFDLEAGQVIEDVFPEGALSAAQRKEICLMSFPDSNSHITLDTCYVIKPKRRGARRYDYGYVYFRQKRDPSLPRGYLQQSLVLLSRWPFVSLLEQVLKRVAGRFYAMCPISPTPYREEGCSTSTALVGHVRVAEGGGGVVAAAPSAAACDDLQQPFAHVIRADAMELSAGAELPPVEAAVGAALVCVLAGMDPRLHRLPARQQLLVDTLQEMASWSYPESCCEFAFPFMGGVIRWQAPKFVVTTRTTTVNCSRRDVLRPSHRIRSATWHLQARHASMRPPLQARRESEVSAVSTLSTDATPVHSPLGRKLDDSKVNASVLDRLSGTRYVLGEIPLYSTFRALLKRLWRLWELSLLGEPLCVLSKTPTVSSAAVLAIASLIHPISSCADTRPYFSVQDPDFRYISKIPPAKFANKGPIIGATNPYFLKVLKAWPHLLVLDDHQTLEYVSQQSNAGDDSEAGIDEASPPLSPQAKPAPTPQGGTASSGIASGLKSLVTSKTVRERLLSEYQEVFVSDRAYAVNDSADIVRAVTSQLMVGDDAMTDQVNSNVLRSHFLHLTDNFLKPLVNCFTYLWDNDSTLFALRKKGFRARYTRDHFKNHVRNHGYVKKIFKRDSKRVFNLYDRFVDGCHFENWLEERVVERFKLELSLSNPACFAEELGEGQRIEVFMILCSELASEEMQLARDSAHIGLLLTHINAVLQSLPQPMHKPLLRSHYKTAWGSDTTLPPWAVESEMESGAASPTFSPESQPAAPPSEAQPEGPGSGQPGGAAASCAAAADEEDDDDGAGSDTGLDSWRARVKAAESQSLTPPPQDGDVMSPTASVSPTPSEPRAFPGAEEGAVEVV